MSISIQSQDSDERATPDALFLPLDRLFHFTLDPCATAQNAKCAWFFTLYEDGLQASWSRRIINLSSITMASGAMPEMYKYVPPFPEREVAFVNPPYSRGQIQRWLEKALSEPITSAFVLPMDLSTEWGQWIWVHADIVHFCAKRFKFGYASGAKFGTIIVVIHDGLTAPHVDLRSLFAAFGGAGFCLSWSSLEAVNMYTGRALNA